jgi:hypothetical protein
VANADAGEALAEKQYVSYMLRLVVGASGRVVEGELVGLDGASLGHFADWEALVRLLARVVGKS